MTNIRHKMEKSYKKQKLLKNKWIKRDEDILKTKQKKTKGVQKYLEVILT